MPVGYGQAAGAELTISGFTSTYGGWVSIFTAVAMCCFAFSTVLGGDFMDRDVSNFFLVLNPSNLLWLFTH